MNRTGKVRIFITILAAITTAMAAPAFADTISGTAGAAFQSWTGANLNESGAPYWDNMSLDGSNMMSVFS